MTSKLQFVMVIVIVAHLISHGISGTIGIVYLIIFMISLSMLGLLGMVIWRWSGRRWASPAVRRMMQVMTEIKDLNFEEAKKRAQRLLKDTTKFKCSTASINLDLSYQLSASLQEFFSTYESVEAIAGEAQVNRSLTGPSAYQKGFLRIGTNSDFTEIAVRPNEDFIYEIDGSENSEEDFNTSRLPSIYHWILVTAEALYGSKDKSAI